MNKEHSAIADAIPQLSFDIIARICPGLLIITSWVLVYLGPIKAITTSIELIKNNKTLTFGFVVLIIVFCYLLSIFIFGLKRLISSKDNIIDIKSKNIDPSDNAIKFDILRFKSPVVGARLNKLRAEAQGSEVLFYGLLFSSIVNIYFLIFNISGERIIFEVLLVFASISAKWFNKYISDIYNLSLDNHYKICVQDKLSVEAFKK